MEQALRASDPLIPIDMRREPTGPRGAPALGLADPPSPAEKARHMFEEARAVSLDHLSAVETAMVSLRALLEATVEGGELYAPGLREFAGRLAEDLDWKTKTLRMLSLRQAAPVCRA